MIEEEEIIDKEWSPKGSRGPMLNALSRVEMSICLLLKLVRVRERERERKRERERERERECDLLVKAGLSCR